MVKPRIALVCIAKNEDDYLEEWIMYHLALGVDRVFVYENDWRWSGYNCFAEFIPWDGKVKQLAAYNDWLVNRSQDFDWAMFIDVDEFLVNRTPHTLPDLLAKCSNLNQIGVNWRIMGSNGIEKAANEKSVLKRFTRGGKFLNEHVKQLVNLDLHRREKLPQPRFLNPHFTNESSWAPDRGMFKGAYGPYAGEDFAPLEIFHYAVKSREEFEQKVARGRADILQTRKAEKEDFWKRHDQNDELFTEARDVLYS